MSAGKTGVYGSVGDVMRFRVHFWLSQEISRDLEIHYRDPAGDFNARIAWHGLEHPDAEEMSEDEWEVAQSVGQGGLELFFELDPPRKTLRHLSAAAESRLPEDVPWREELSFMFQEDGRRRPEYDGFLVPLDAYNNSLREFLRSLRETAIQHARLFEGALSSICGNDVRASYRSAALESDGEWRQLPESMMSRYTPSPRPLPALDEVTPEALARSLASSREEFLGHRLLEEARNSYGRARAVLAMTAVEVHTKQFIAEVAPNTAWLLENLPSPPMVKLLTDFVPTLTVPQPIDGRVLPPPTFLVNDLMAGAQVRNAVVHRGQEVSWQVLERVVSAAQDVIWLLDHYRGVEWAEGQMRERTWTALMSITT